MTPGEAVLFAQLLLLTSLSCSMVNLHGNQLPLHKTVLCSSSSFHLWACALACLCMCSLVTARYTQRASKGQRLAHYLHACFSDSFKPRFLSWCVCVCLCVCVCVWVCSSPSRNGSCTDTVAYLFEPQDGNTEPPSLKESFFSSSCKTHSSFTCTRTHTHTHTEPSLVWVSPGLCKVTECSE